VFMLCVKERGLVVSQECNSLTDMKENSVSVRAMGTNLN
jgi:hypothetical protein